MFDDLSDEAIDMIVRSMTDAASPLVFSELRHAAADTSAVGNREATFNLVMAYSSPRPKHGRRFKQPSNTTKPICDHTCGAAFT
jgi:hypothetical protein